MNNPLKGLRGKAKKFFFMLPSWGYDFNWSFSEVMQHLPGENQRYKYFYSFSHLKMDKDLLAHRKYFASNKRGFGEDAFHAMWLKLISETKPQNLLEIGVYRGQTLSLWKLISRKINLDNEVWGVTPLSEIGDDVSRYESLDYEEDINKNFQHFDLQKPNIFRSLSQEPKAVDFIKNREWDVIYIDGSHDYPDVLLDVGLAISCLRKGGILVMDDSSAFSEFRPPFFAFAGHEGPSRVAVELGKNEEVELIGTCGHNRVFRKK